MGLVLHRGFLRAQELRKNSFQHLLKLWGEPGSQVHLPWPGSRKPRQRLVLGGLAQIWAMFACRTRGPGS